MARTRSFDDEAAVRAAMDLFWVQGYQHTSLPQLQRVTGLSRSSLYAAYGSKRGLFERASLAYLRDVIDPLLAPMEAPGSGADAIAGFFMAMAVLIRSPDSRISGRGCFTLNTVLELDHLDEQATEMVTTYRARVHAAVANALASIETVDDRESQAALLTAGHVGVMVTARIDPPAAAAASEAMAADVRRWPRD